MFDIPLPSKKDVNISIPQKTEIVADTYNKNLTDLKKSFKECSEMIDDMYIGTTNVVMTEETVEEYQENYTNSIMFESYCDGPMFEKVNEENKEEIKALARKIRTKINKGHANFIDYFKGRAQVTNKATTFIGMMFDIWVIDPAIISTFNNSQLKLKSWQTISYLIPSREESIKKVLEKMNAEFKDDLGTKYEIDVVKLRLLGSVFTKKKELSDDDKERMGNLKDLFFRPLLLIIKNKGTSASNKEPEIKVELSQESVGKLTKMKNRITGFLSKIKNKVTGKKSDPQVENKNESTEVKDCEKEDKKEDKKDKKKEDKDEVKKESVEEENFEESVDDDFELDDEITESVEENSDEEDIELD